MTPLQRYIVELLAEMSEDERWAKLAELQETAKDDESGLIEWMTAIIEGGQVEELAKTPMEPIPEPIELCHCLYEKLAGMISPEAGQVLDVYAPLGFWIHQLYISHDWDRDDARQELEREMEAARAILFEDVLHQAGEVVGAVWPEEGAG